MPLIFEALATAVPPFSVAQADAAQAASAAMRETDRQTRLVGTLYRRSGVETRHLTILDRQADPGDGVPQSFYQPPDEVRPKGPTTAERMARYEADSPALATLACQRALSAAAVDPATISHLVTVSCSGFAAPGFDVALFETLGLAPTTSRTHVGFMGCHGALNGLRTADALAAQAAIHSPSQPHVLMCATEICGMHHQFTDKPELLVANALFSDGAAAVIGRSSRAAERGALEDVTGWRLLANGSFVVPGSTDLMGWRIRDNGFEMNLSPKVPDAIQTHLRPFLSRWLDRQGLTIDAIAGWAIHPGGPRIVSAVLDTLGLTEDRVAASRAVLARYGNMSSPTLLFILEQLRATSVTGPVVALGFGPGLTIEAALFAVT